MTPLNSAVPHGVSHRGMVARMNGDFERSSQACDNVDDPYVYVEFHEHCYYDMYARHDRLEDLIRRCEEQEELQHMDQPRDFRLIHIMKDLSSRVKSEIRMATQVRDSIWQELLQELDALFRERFPDETFDGLMRNQLC